MVQTPIIEIVSLCKSFGNELVLHNLDLTVLQGEHVVVIGLSGSGKSVLLDHIIGFLEPDQGKVYVFGKDMQSSKEAERYALLERFGMVFQGSALFDSMSVLENIAFPLCVRGKDSSNAWQQAEEMLDRVGLSRDDGDRVPAELSGGMARRAAIARALIHHPPILLSDEPTAGLDIITSRRISRLIRSVHQERGMTCVTITHDPICASEVADRILLLDKNEHRLKECMSPEEISVLRDRMCSSEAQRAIQAKLEQFLEGLSPIAEDVDAHDHREKGLRLLESVPGLFTTIGELFYLAFSFRIPMDSGQVVRRMFDLGVRSLPLIGTAGALVGMALSAQAAVSLSRFASEELVPDVVSVSLVREIAPLLTGLLLAGRVGASVSAEIGSMKVTKQIDALRSLGVPPDRYLYAPIFWSALVCGPLLTILSAALGIFGSYMLSVHVLGLKSSLYLTRTWDALQSIDVASGFTKSVLFALTVSAVGYYYGTREKRGTDEVGVHVTKAVVVASLLIVVLDFVLSQVFVVVH